MKRRIWIPVLLVLLGVGGWLIFAQPRATPALEVNTVTVKRGEFVREAKATGSVDARIYTLTFPRPGRVARVLVREGQSVPKGALLAELDTADDAARLISARESLEATRVRLGTNANETSANRVKLNANLENARRKLNLAKRLLTVGAIAQNEVDDAERTVTDLEAQVRILDAQSTGGQSDLEAQRAARETEIQTLERSIRQATLRAPVAGTVSKVDFLPGTETAQGILKLVEDATLTIRARLSEADATFVKPGQPARIELDAAPNRPLQAKVDRLGVQGEVQGQGGSAILPVVLRFLSPEAKTMARPGLTAVARITAQRIPDAVLVPLEALVEQNKALSVWVMETARSSDGKTSTSVARQRPVKVQARNLTQAAVTGLEAGMELISLPPDTLKDGDRIKKLEKAVTP